MTLLLFFMTVTTYYVCALQLHHTSLSWIFHKRILDLYLAKTLNRYVFAGMNFLRRATKFIVILLLLLLMEFFGRDFAP